MMPGLRHAPMIRQVSWLGIVSSTRMLHERAQIHGLHRRSTTIIYMYAIGGAQSGILEQPREDIVSFVTRCW